MVHLRLSACCSGRIWVRWRRSHELAVHAALTPSTPGDPLLCHVPQLARRHPRNLLAGVLFCHLSVIRAGGLAECRPSPRRAFFPRTTGVGRIGAWFDARVPRPCHRTGKRPFTLASRLRRPVSVPAALSLPRLSTVLQHSEPLPALSCNVSSALARAFGICVEPCLSCSDGRVRHTSRLWACCFLDCPRCMHAALVFLRNQFELSNLSIRAPGLPSARRQLSGGLRRQSPPRPPSSFALATAHCAAGLSFLPAARPPFARPWRPFRCIGGRFRLPLRSRYRCWVPWRLASVWLALLCAACCVGRPVAAPAFWLIPRAPGSACRCHALGSLARRVRAGHCAFCACRLLDSETVCFLLGAPSRYFSSRWSRAAGSRLLPRSCLLGTPGLCVALRATAGVDRARARGASFRSRAASPRFFGPVSASCRADHAPDGSLRPRYSPTFRPRVCPLRSCTPAPSPVPAHATVCAFAHPGRRVLAPFPFLRRCSSAAGAVRCRLWSLRWWCSAAWPPYFCACNPRSRFLGEASAALALLFPALLPMRCPRALSVAAAGSFIPVCGPRVSYPMRPRLMAHCLLLPHPCIGSHPAPSCGCAVLARFSPSRFALCPRPPRPLSNGHADHLRRPTRTRSPLAGGSLFWAPRLIGSCKLAPLRSGLAALLAPRGARARAFPSVPWLAAMRAPAAALLACALGLRRTRFASRRRTLCAVVRFLFSRSDSVTRNCGHVRLTCELLPSPPSFAPTPLVPASCLFQIRLAAMCYIGPLRPFLPVARGLSPSGVQTPGLLPVPFSLCSALTLPAPAVSPLLYVLRFRVLCR